MHSATPYRSGTTCASTSTWSPRTLPDWTPREAVDTLRLARKTWPLPSYRLGALVEHRNLADGMPPDLQPHRATYDALVTARLFVDLAGTGGPEPLSLAALREAGGLDLTLAEPELRLFD